MVDLFGEYRHKVDAKGRLALPAKFRKVLLEDQKVQDEGLVVTIEPLNRQCLYVFTPDDYSVWVKSFFNSENGVDNNNFDEVDKRRRLRRAGASVQFDGAGRINLEQSQRSRVEIDKEVVVVGNEGYIEIWDAKRWDDIYGDEL